MAQAAGAADHDSSAPALPDVVSEYPEDVEETPRDVEDEYETEEDDTDLPSHEDPHYNETEPTNETNSTIPDDEEQAENGASGLKTGIITGSVAAAAAAAWLI